MTVVAAVAAQIAPRGDGEAVAKDSPDAPDGSSAGPPKNAGGPVSGPPILSNAPA